MIEVTRSYKDLWDADNLYATCLHEAAGACVARHYGESAYWRVFARKEGEYVRGTENRWRGRLRWFNERGIGLIDTKVVLAGVVAEVLCQTPDECPYVIDDYIQSGVLELTDSEWDLIGQYRIRDLSETVKLVRRLMPSILSEVDCFLHEMEVPDV